jgi:hypothetical protein
MYIGLLQIFGKKNRRANLPRVSEELQATLDGY